MRICRSELESEFRRTRRVLSQLSYFPGEAPVGIVATATAWLASALKVKLGYFVVC